MSRFFLSISLIAAIAVSLNIVCQIDQRAAQCKDLCFKDQNYFMKPTYQARTEYLPDDHTHNGEDHCQEEVYQAAANLVPQCAAKVVADVGCGSGVKVLQYFPNLYTIGFEVEPNFSCVTSRYPDKKWYYGDFSFPDDLPFCDIIVCADVIEHLTDPDQLLNWLRRLDFKYLVISTPDKDMLPRYQQPPEQSQSGPPVNPHHVREWSFAELEQYIGQYFKIERHFHNKIEWMAQVIIATKK